MRRRLALKRRFIARRRRATPVRRGSFAFPATCYKVVLVDNPNEVPGLTGYPVTFRSVSSVRATAIIGGRERPVICPLVYSMGERTKALSESYGLFAFASEGVARACAESIPWGTAVMECKYEEARWGYHRLQVALVKELRMQPIPAKDWEAFQRGEQVGEEDIYGWGILPTKPGTILVGAVVPIREVCRIRGDSSYAKPSHVRFRVSGVSPGSG